MIRNAIQVFWTKPLNPKENNSFGFKSLRHFYMSAYYSLYCLKKHGYNVTIVTDDYGKRILVDMFGLQYDKIDLSLNEFENSVHLWGLSKNFAYGLQKEPFIYVDLDAYLIEDISPDMHRADIICQNIETEYPVYYSSYLQFRRFITSTDHVFDTIENGFKNNIPGNAYNTAIFGGNDLTTIKKAGSSIFEFVKKNYLHEIHCMEQMDGIAISILSVFLEQIYLYYYLNFNHPEVTVQQLLPPNINCDLSYFKTWNNMYVHLIYTLKKDGVMLDRLEQESIQAGFLRLEESFLGLGYEQLLHSANIKY
jgi:hypothetical protein